MGLVSSGAGDGKPVLGLLVKSRYRAWLAGTRRFVSSGNETKASSSPMRFACNMTAVFKTTPKNPSPQNPSSRFKYSPRRREKVRGRVY